VKDILRYDKMVEAAWRGVVRQALHQVAMHGLPGAHHFYIGFRTNAPEVKLPDYLRAEYPTDMTVVLEHQFWDLEVGDEHFAVTLKFKGRAERLRVPFAAITSFMDPSVKFVLEFQTLEAEPASPPPAAEAAPDEEGKTGQVVTLDAFRKK
jgi:uncharacterized protein